MKSKKVNNNQPAQNKESSKVFDLECNTPDIDFK